MPKEIMIVYQDCPTCGARKEWGEKTIKAALNAKAFVRKVSFVTREGEQLIAKAVENASHGYHSSQTGKHSPMM